MTIRGRGRITALQGDVLCLGGLILLRSGEKEDVTDQEPAGHDPEADRPLLSYGGDPPHIYPTYIPLVGNTGSYLLELLNLCYSRAILYCDGIQVTKPRAAY